MKLVAEDLVKNGFLFSELPPVFTTRDFGHRYSSLFSSAQLDQLSRAFPSSECVYYSVPKGGYARKTLGIPNPLHYALLAEVLQKKTLSINSHLRSQFSCTLPLYDQNTEAFQHKKTFVSFRRQCFLISGEATFELKLDISRYYPTIYTHVISWALHGRATAKQRWRDPALLGNLIDKHTRNLQSGQSAGLPIGPFTSLITSELIGCRLDKEILSRFPSVKGARYIDDYYFYFSSKADAESFLKFFQPLLAEYLLSLNEEKTTITEFPFSTDPLWVISLRSLAATCFKEEKEQESDIRQFFSAAFDWAKKYPNEEVMKFAAKSLLDVQVSDKSWDYFQAWLLKMGLYNPYTLPEVSQILFKNKKRLNRRAVAAFIQELLKIHSSKRHSFEIAWTLWITRVLRMRVPNKLAEPLFDSNDVVPTLLALDLKREGLIGKTVRTTKLKLDLTKEALMDGRWLLAYESVLQGWLSPRRVNRSFIRSHAFFSKLHRAGVSFFNPGVPQYVSVESHDYSL